MLDFNDFQTREDTSNQNTNNNPQSSDLLNNMFQNTNFSENILVNPSSVDEEEQKRISARQKEAEERKEKINKKIQEEEEARMEIRKKAVEYLAEFEEKRKEEIAKKRKELEEKGNNQNQGNSSNSNADSWSKISGNIDLKDSEYKGSKDVQRMREAMLNRQSDPNSEPLQKFFG